jgi:hypothetical protein
MDDDADVDGSGTPTYLFYGMQLDPALIVNGFGSFRLEPFFEFGK